MADLCPYDRIFNDFRLILHSLVAVALLVLWGFALQNSEFQSATAELLGSPEKLRQANEDLIREMDQLSEQTVRELLAERLQSEPSVYEALESVVLDLPKVGDLVLAVLVFIFVSQCAYFLVRALAGDANRAARINLLVYHVLLLGLAILVLNSRDISIDWWEWWSGVIIGTVICLGIYFGYRVACVFGLVAALGGALFSVFNGDYFIREIGLFVVYLDASIAVLIERHQKFALTPVSVA